MVRREKNVASIAPTLFICTRFKHVDIYHRQSKGSLYRIHYPHHVLEAVATQARTAVFFCLLCPPWLRERTKSFLAESRVLSPGENVSTPLGSDT